MNKKAIVFAVMTVSLSAGATAFAQDNNYRHDRNDRHERSDRDGRQARDGRDGRDERRYDNDRRDHRDGRRDSYGRRSTAMITAITMALQRPAPQLPSRRLRVARIPRFALVKDWHRYRLSAPPRGMH